MSELQAPVFAANWLQAAHTAIDEAVAAAYEWEYSPDMTDEEFLTRILGENQARAGISRAN